LDGHEFNCTTAHKYYFERDNFERDLWPAIRDCIKPESVVYDFGAHFGFWAVRLSRLVRHVYAFEPSRQNREFLYRNLAKLPNVTVTEAAVGATSGEIAFSENGSMSTAGTGSFKVPMIALDDFARTNEPPDFMLVDVEGYAGEALRGASAVLTLRPALICEIHHAEEDAAVIPWLRERGYEVRYLDRTHPYPFRIAAR
jgi:FkbM family methyltransferase